MDAAAKELAREESYDLPFFFSYFAEDYTNDHLAKFVKEIEEIDETND